MSTPRRGLVVGSAPLPGFASWYAQAILSAETLIAADGGLVLCLDAGRVPDVCVGDFDSVAPAALLQAAEGGAEILPYPVTKDASDLDLAVEAARRAGVERLDITAAFTGRIDHTLAALGTVLRAADMVAVAREPLWRGYALDTCGTSCLQLREPEQTVLSVMVLGGEAVVSITGVMYPLKEHPVGPVSALGLSNIATAPVQE
ncbi:thiamine diphosphokinase, partial [bacterium]|nr:thiamine diphosphokinase [bacterium]